MKEDVEVCTECGCEIDIDPASEEEWTCYNGLYVCGECDDAALATEREGNTNCLQGMQCPTCHAYEPFRIAVTTIVFMYDEGSEDDKMGRDQEWDETSYCECCACGFSGTVNDFQVAKTKGTT